MIRYSTTPLRKGPQGQTTPHMIDVTVLRAKMQPELDRLGLAGDLAEKLVRELNFLACLLIEAAEEGRFNG
jgi:hypothetical protein